MPRLYLTSPLNNGAEVPLEDAQLHYLKNVMRLSPGEKINVFNGRDGEWQAEIATLGKNKGSINLKKQIRPQQNAPNLWLLFAPIKRARIDVVAEKAGELGVRRLWPIMTRHTDVARVNTDRLLAHAIEAAEQCGRMDVPEVSEPETLPRSLVGWPKERRLIVCAEFGLAEPIAAAITKLPEGPAAILVGPEGGFTEAEIELLTAQAFVTPVTLGPRILRAETAAIAALSCWQALRGDWGS